MFVCTIHTLHKYLSTEYTREDYSRHKSNTTKYVLNNHWISISKQWEESAAEKRQNGEWAQSAGRVVRRMVTRGATAVSFVSRAHNKGPQQLAAVARRGWTWPPFFASTPHETHQVSTHWSRITHLPRHCQHHHHHLHHRATLRMDSNPPRTKRQNAPPVARPTPLHTRANVKKKKVVHLSK